MDDIDGHGRVSEVFTAIPLPEALVQTLFAAIRRVETNQMRQTEALTDARERLIRMEQVDYHAKIEAQTRQLNQLTQRLEKLETESSERRGMQKLVDWVVRYGWVILLGIIYLIAARIDRFKV